MNFFSGKLIVTTGLLVAFSLSLTVNATEISIPDISGKILTVKGPIKPELLGPTIMHEHIFLDWKVPPSRKATDAKLYIDPVSLRNLSVLRVRATASRENLLLTDMDLSVE